ncbi:MAG: mandelate racemase [Verrucomicrobiae bacterium]|nr:mandelate racemase [Verrucomicrobiae bacterium]
MARTTASGAMDGGMSRRRFLAGMAGGAAGLAWAASSGGAPVKGLRIARIETFPLVYPMRGHFKFFEAAGGRPAGRPAVLVKITADDGTVGWGQSVPIPRWSYETLESVVTTVDRYLAPELSGLDPFDSEAVEAAMNRAIAPSFSTGQPIAKAGVDLALFDLTGRRLGQDATARWKRRGRDRLTLSWTLNPRTLDEVEGLVAEGQAQGYRHFNVKVAPDPAFDVELCRLVKRLVPDGFLWADANGGYDEATALAVAPRLARLGVPVLEQPLPPNRIHGYRRLKRQGAIPIIMDEGIVSHVELREFIRLRMLDGVAMKPARCGGIVEARRQIEMVLDAGMMFLGSGLTDPDVSLAASLALYGAYDLKYPAALNGPQFLGHKSVLRAPFEVRGGELEVPRGPGLGVEVDEARIPELMVVAL